LKARRSMLQPSSRTLRHTFCWKADSSDFCSLVSTANI
jgi:hypothetical protein